VKAAADPTRVRILEVLEGGEMCVCQGTCPSFKKMDIFNVLADVRREGKVRWVGDLDRIRRPR